MTVRTQGATSNLVILRASRLEALVPQLLALLEQHRPDDVLAPQTVVAAHPGMKQWLMGEMARAAKAVDPLGIVANIEVLLPSEWLNRLAGERSGASSSTAWQRANLRWAIHELLGDPAAGFGETRIARYLERETDGGEAERARRRFQLADRLAAIYSQHLVYRPQWLRDWEAGRVEAATRHVQDADLKSLERDLLAPLWRRLSQRLGPHRAHVAETLANALREPDAAREPIHVFGVSHLAPAEMDVLRAYALHAPVFLYLPDPCREYWGGLQVRATPGPAGNPAAESLAELRKWREDEERRIDQAQGGDWLDDAQHHPLLARWGRLGQHFYASLADWEALADIRHHEDEAPAEPSNRLQRLQESIRRLDVTLMDETNGTRDDASLRIHSCHTRLRELEVLRDALLDAFEHGVEPGGMIVMAPDIGAYAPLISTVFGEPGDARERRLPWHLADAPMMRSHRLFALLARLLEIGTSRVTAPEVADLLAVPEIAAALGLEASARDALLDWLQQSRAAWALDAAHKASFGVPAVPTHTLAWGVDRMLAGYVMGQADGDAPGIEPMQVVTLPDDVTLLPLRGVEGVESAALGALDRLLRELQCWRELANATLPASAWVQRLEHHLDALVRIDRDDEDAKQAWNAVRAIVAKLAAEPAQTGIDPVLHYAVVHDLLCDALAGVPEKQRFLMGGITFCGMVPQRAIPFRVVCVLGLNDGEFPRSRRDGGLDLMARLPRVGDRDVRTDDRWLFLETVMSARDRLHLSWLGQGARDGKPRNPASPLAELLAELDRAAGVSGRTDEASEAARAWLVKHPLQAFDARYFRDGDAALFSYSRSFATMRPGGSKTLPAFCDGTPQEVERWSDPLPLPVLAKFWKKPAESLLERHLQLDFSALDDDTLPSSEPLEASLERRETVARRVFFATLPQPEFDSGRIPAWVEHGGLLPPGELGAQAWKNEAEAVLKLRDCAMNQGIAKAATQAIEVDVVLPLPEHGEVHLRGQVDRVQWFQADGVHGWRMIRAFPKAPDLKKASDLHFGDRLPMFIEWAALRLATLAQDEVPAVRLVVLADGSCELEENILVWDEHFFAYPKHRKKMLDALRANLAQLVRRWRQAQAEPPLYFPRTSQKALDALHSDKGLDPAKAAEDAFEPGFGGYMGERNDSDAMRFLARGVSFDPYVSRESANRLLEYAKELESLMTLVVPESEAEAKA